MSDQSINPAHVFLPKTMSDIRREFGKWLLRLIIVQGCFFAVLFMGSKIVKALVGGNHFNYAFALALILCSFAGFNLAWLWEHRDWHSSHASKDAPKRVLILAYCGHRRWIDADAPMDSEARAIEKCRPCPDCLSEESTSLK